MRYRLSRFYGTRRVKLRDYATLDKAKAFIAERADLRKPYVWQAIDDEYLVRVNGRLVYHIGAIKCDC